MRHTLSIFPIVPLLILTSCQVVKPYAPPATQAVVTEVEVEIKDFYGQTDAYAHVKGFLTSGVSVLVDAKQHREGNRVYLEVMEQTPRGAVPTPQLSGPQPFDHKIPIDILGLLHGQQYVLNANGIEALLEIPAPDENLAPGEVPYQSEEVAEIGPEISML